jgi:hypothetical protein
VTCQECRHEFDSPLKKAIEKRRQEAPAHHWLVLKESGEEFPLQGIEAIAKAISDGSLLPSYRAVTGPYLPAEPVRTLAGKEKKLKKLYDPVWAFADFWSWLLVVLIPAACLSLIGLVIDGNAAIGLIWPVAVAVILVSLALFMVTTMLMNIQGCGPLIVFLITGGFLGYLALLVVGALGFLLLGALHKAMCPLARLIGRAIGVEKKRISNWEGWMEA